MNANQLMTGAAVGLAAFALYQFTKKPGQMLASQPGQQQRDAGLQSWMNSLWTPDYFGQAATGYNALTMSTIGAIAPIVPAGLTSYTQLTDYLNGKP